MDSQASLSNIPQGSRIMLRVHDGVDSFSGRAQFRDYIGHVLEINNSSIVLERDKPAHGYRPAQIVIIPTKKIVHVKPIPERPRLSPTLGEDVQSVG